MLPNDIKIPSEKIAELCKAHHIKRLALFGSVLGPDFGPGSDIDILVEFEDGHVPGLAFFGLEADLADLFGRTVDLNTPGFLSRYFREQVVNDSEAIYVAG